MFTSHVAAFERPVRFALGAGIAVSAWFGLQEPSILLVAIGVCVALTGIGGLCPACAIVGRQVQPKE